MYRKRNIGWSTIYESDINHLYQVKLRTSSHLFCTFFRFQKMEMIWSLLVHLSVFFSVLFSFWYWKSCRHSSKFPPGTVFEFDQIDFKCLFYLSILHINVSSVVEFLKMVGPKQNFWPRINISTQRIFF